MTNVLPWPNQAPRIARYVWPQLQEPQVDINDRLKEAKFTHQQLMEGWTIEDIDHALKVTVRAANQYKASGYEHYLIELKAIELRLQAVLDGVTDEISTQRNEEAAK